ncbi:SdpI family protein [Candidatus Parcubacteria bacterium]|nr:SdpI family protein [Candidatus Parcubacteria bacterium]
MRKTEIIALGIILISFLIGIYFYNRMPDMMASHWNARGEVNDYMSKFWALFLMPLMSLGLFLLFLVVPKIDPLKQNIEKFRKYFDTFIVLMLGFLFYIYLLTIFWNLGIRFSMIQLMIPAMAALFYYCGILVENAKRNWFIGIKTPWTLSNENVWNKTHKLGGKLFKSAGIIILLGIVLESYAPYFVLVPILFVSIYLVVYSYLEYQKEIKIKK